MALLRRAAPVALLALCLSACGGASPPNVVLLVMDTTRADRLTIDGYERGTTPRLAALARESVVYRDAWSASPWTGPSHATIFTGLRPEHHGYYYGNRLYLTDSFPTLAEQLAGAGYATAGFTNNEMVSDAQGLTQGFGEFESFPLEHPGEKPSAAWAHARGLAFAARSVEERRPFFLFLNDMEPHLEYAPAPEFQSRFLSGEPPEQALAAAREFDGDDALAVNAGVRTVSPEQWRIMSDLYDAEIAELDHEIGRLIDGLEGAGVLEHTLLVITADHGENLGDHGLASHHFSVHRTLLRVPLLVRLPGVFDGGRNRGDVVRLEDLYPTILSQCGVEVPAGLDGEALSGSIGGRIARGLWGFAPMDQLLARFPDARTDRLRARLVSTYDGRHHLIAGSDGREELYDVQTDPGEQVNLAPRGGAALERMRKLAQE